MSVKDETTFQCSSCQANWSAGEFGKDCDECGGGALKRNCTLCNSKCDSIYLRAIIDSWDTHEAHWNGSCKLPEEEKQKLIAARIYEAQG
ncbi:MAG: hypothetical protein GY763_13900 [Gammaproteobacteria bacterium]|nr:hypothetical protein [Gammaproteobacteria bacterium]